MDLVKSSLTDQQRQNLLNAMYELALKMCKERMDDPLAKLDDALPLLATVLLDRQPYSKDQLKQALLHVFKDEQSGVVQYMY